MTTDTPSPLQRQPMRDGEEFRVFDRESWQRKARPPTWFQREEIEKHALRNDDLKPSKEL